MGLLDPEMALAAGLLGGGNFGQALGRGMAGAQAVQLAEQRRREMEAQAEERRAMAEQRQAQAQQLQAQSQRDAQFQSALQQGATPSQLAQYFPEKVDLLKKLAEAPNFGRQAVARTAEVEGPNGAKMIRQLDQYGQPVSEDMAGYVAPQGVNLGNKYVFAKPVAGQSLEMGMSPSERDASARGWAGNAIAQQRLAMEQAQGEKPQWVESLGGFANPRTQQVMPARDMNGNPIAGAGPKMTEDQGKATGWLVQAENAKANMDKVLAKNPNAAKPGFNDALASIPSFGATEGIANMFRGADRQQFLQAADSISEAVLRAATGAGVNKDEARQKAKELTPQIGDSEEVILQKQKAIPLYIESLKVRAGPGAKQAANVLASQSPNNQIGNIPPKAIAELKMRGKSAKAQFDAAFGAGAADSVLGGN